MLRPDPLEREAEDANRVATRLVTTQVTPNNCATPTIVARRPGARTVRAPARAHRPCVRGKSLERARSGRLLGRPGLGWPDLFPLEANEELRAALDGHLAMELSGLEKSENVTERPPWNVSWRFTFPSCAGRRRAAGSHRGVPHRHRIRPQSQRFGDSSGEGRRLRFSLLYASLFPPGVASRQLTRHKGYCVPAKSTFRELFANANDIVFHPQPGRKLHPRSTGAGERLTGYTRDRSAGSAVSQVVHPGAAGGSPRDAGQECHRHRPDHLRPRRSRAQRQIEVGRLKSARDDLPEGKPVGVQGIARDITERKRAEEEIQRQREALYQSEKLAAVGESSWRGWPTN